jgi:Xaa-Pro dipeptidase
MQADRLQRLAAMLSAENLDAVALIPGSSFRYMTGGSFALMERPTMLLLPRRGRAVAIMPYLEAEAWAALGVDAETILWKDEEGFTGAFTAAATLLDAQRIGVEGLVMRVAERNALAAAFPAATLLDVQGPLAGLRTVKDAGEVALLRQAVVWSEQALARTLDAIRIGMTEVEVKSMLIQNLFSFPIDGLSFDPIVLAGGNAARPHGHARADYQLAHGDALLFDFGVTCGFYAADITRTVFVGGVSDEHRALYDTVLAANQLGHEIARAGVTAHEVDDAVRGLLERSQFSPFVIHKTGHGLGLDIHEAPQIMRGNHTKLEAGNIITIEPGLYQPDALGVRIEDNVLITADGCESLSTFPRELRIVG